MPLSDARSINRRSVAAAGLGDLMTLSCSLRRGVQVVVATAAALGMSFGLQPPTAAAFYVQNHALITRNALPANEVDQNAMALILVGPPPGAGVVGSDAFATEDWRHLDNSNNPVELCNRATTAWNVISPALFGGALPTGPGGTDLVNGPAARAAFGGLAHTQQDFYAHSNWVEINTAIGQPERLAPPIFPTCDPAAFPPDLHTGFFSMDFSSDYPLAGCPPAGPPPGFIECHSQLNKDGPSTPRGSGPVPGTQWNNYDLAALLATRATTDLFWQLRGMVVANANNQPGVDGECVARNLFQADRHESCV
jgi:hypothetical protein